MRPSGRSPARDERVVGMPVGIRLGPAAARMAQAGTPHLRVRLRGDDSRVGRVQAGPQPRQRGTVGSRVIQDELGLEVSEPTVKVTEADVIAALERRYSATAGNGRRYATAYGVRSHAGFDARRTADFVAMDLWPSGGLRLHGHEVKVSRSDWLRELKAPEKAAEFIPYMNCWWLVVSDKRIVRPGELPDDWGLLALRGADLAVVRPAPKRDAKPMSTSRLAALLRAVAQTAAYRERRDHERRYRCHSGDSKCTAVAELAGFPPERLSELVVVCACTQVPELGPCEHQRAIETVEAS